MAERDLDETEMWDAFAAAVDRAGGVRGFARLADVQPSFVSNAFRGKERISDRLLLAAGLERVITYRRLSAGEVARRLAGRSEMGSDARSDAGSVPVALGAPR